MGFLLAGILLGEGLSLLDLTAAPGWPGTWDMLRGPDRPDTCQGSSGT